MAKKEDANNTEEQNKTATTPPAEAPATGKPATETPEAEAPEAEAPEAEEESKSESGGLGGFLKGLDWNELASTASSIKDMFTDSDEKNKQSMQEVLTTLQAATADKAVLTDSFNALENLSFKDLIGKPMTAAIEAQAEAAKSTLDFVKQMCVTSADGSQQVAVVSFEFFKNGKKARINLPLLSLVNIPSLEIKSMTYKFTAKIDSHSSLIVTHGDSPVKSTSGSIGTPAPKDGEKKEEGKKDDGKKAEEKKGEEKKGTGDEKTTADAQKTSQKKADETATVTEPKKTGETAKDAGAQNILSNAAKNTTIAASYTAQTGTSATKDSKYAVSTTMDINITIEPNEIPGGIKTMLSILDGAIEVINPNGELIVNSPEVTLGSNGYVFVGASYRDPDGLCSPASISCTALGGQKAPIVMMNSEGANIIFSEPGLYSVTAGKLSQPVIVSGGAETPSKKSE